MDDPFADAPTVSPSPPLATARAPQPPQQQNPFDAAPTSGAGGNPFADAPQGQGVGYPALGMVPPSNTPSIPGLIKGGAAFFGGLPKEVLGQGVNAPSPEPAPEANQSSPFARLGTYLGKQPPDYLANKIGKGFQFLEDTTEDWMTKGLTAIGVPRSQSLARDIGAYLFEGGNVTDIGGAAEHATPRESVVANGPMGIISKVESGNRNIGQNIVDINTAKGTPAQGYFQIIDPTWKRYAPPDVAAKYKSAIDAPYSVQAEVASNIPLKAWGPNTRAALERMYPGIDLSQTLGEAQKAYGGQLRLVPGAPAGIRARAVGAEASNPSEAPAPNRQWFQEQDDKFFQLRQRHQKDEAEFMEAVNNIPDEFKTPEMQERFYKFMEDPNSTELSPSEQAFYKATIEPLKREERDLYEELKKTNLDVRDYDPTYAHRIVRGRAPVFDALSGERGASFNPISGYKSFTAPSLKSRKFYVLEDARGNRKVVALSDGRLTELNNGLDTPLQPDKPGKGEEALKGVGDTVSIGGKQYTLKNAKTDEIEAKTGTRYYKNALANTIDNLIKLRAAARAQYLFNDLKASPQFMTLARRFDGNQPIPEGWRSVQMPTFRGWALEPKFADMVDDFYGGTKSALGDKLTKINQLAVRSLFMTPTPHLLNTFAMWSVARGWDMATPMGIRSFLVDGTKAFKAVFTMNKEYREMLDHGAGLVYSGVKNQDFYRQMMNRLGENIKRDPSSWDPIARIMGVGPSDLIKIIYDGSSKILWGGTDFFLMQRIYELKRKGMSTHDAIVEAEKFIPNYRIPSQVLGSRRFALLLKDPSLTEFSRYHYGVWKSLAHLANDLAGPKATVAKRFDTIGKIAVGGGLLFGVWPVISYGIQKLTGDKDLEFSPKGSTKIPADLLAWYNGDKQFIDVISDSIIMAPVLKEGLEQFFNANFFQAGHNMPGQSIVDKVDQQQGLGHQALIRGQHAAQDLVAPYGALEQAGRPKGSAEKEALSMMLGTRKKPKKYVPGSRDYKSHAKRPKGLIEKGIDKL